MTEDDYEIPVYPEDPLYQPEPPAPVDVAVIHSAVHYGDYIQLVITVIGEQEQTGYSLTSTDPHGLAPALRAQLQRMVEAGEITVEQGQ